MSQSDNSQLVEYCDKCHIIVDAVEDECKESGHGEMMALYIHLKAFFRDRHGESSLKALIQSMEPPPTITYGDRDDEIEQEDRCLCDDQCDESKRIYQCPVHPKYEC